MIQFELVGYYAKHLRAMSANAGKFDVPAMILAPTVSEMQKHAGTRPRRKNYRHCKGEAVCHRLELYYPAIIVEWPEYIYLHKLLKASSRI